MARRKRRIRLLRLGVAALTITLLGGLLLWPVVMLLWEIGLRWADAPVRSEMSLSERLQTRSLEVFAAIWFFWLGASVGSFLNVVVYRMPRGISLVWRPSTCPFCNRPIAARDNIPVLGWLLLGGRCRTCRLPISSRYPLVELTAALLFLGLYFVELASGGANLPLREPNVRRGAAEIVFGPAWDLLALYGYHAFLLSVLLAGSLIAYDRQRIPARLAAVALLVGLAAPALSPQLHPVPWQLPRPERWVSLPGLAGVETGVLGAISGALLGCLLAAPGALRQPCRPATRAALGLAAAGLFLGWQAAVSVALLTGLLQWLATSLAASRRLGFRRFPWLACLLAAICVQLVVWRWLAAYPLWPGPRTPGWALGLAIVLAVALHLPVTQTITSSRPQSLPSPGP